MLLFLDVLWVAVVEIEADVVVVVNTSGGFAIFPIPCIVLEFNIQQDCWPGGPNVIRIVPFGPAVAVELAGLRGEKSEDLAVK